MKETIWFRVTCWGRMAETASNYVKKGEKILIEGRLVADQSGNPRTYMRNDGTTGASFEINATNLRLLSSNSENISVPKMDGSADESPDLDIDIPF